MALLTTRHDPDFIFDGTANVPNTIKQGVRMSAMAFLTFYFSRAAAPMIAAAEPPR